MFTCSYCKKKHETAIDRAKCEMDCYAAEKRAEEERAKVEAAKKLEEERIAAEKARKEAEEKAVAEQDAARKALFNAYVAFAMTKREYENCYPEDMIQTDFNENDKEHSMFFVNDKAIEYAKQEGSDEIKYTDYTKALSSWLADKAFRGFAPAVILSLR